MTIGNPRPTGSPPADSVTADDPFPFGWRYVAHQQPDGEQVWEQRALTLDEALHPEEGDQVPETSQHVTWRDYLTGALRIHLAGDPGVVVLSDVLVAWDRPGLRPTAPDVVVLPGVRDTRRVWSTFDIAAEFAWPTLVIEIASPRTTGSDQLIKKPEYERAGVPLYIIIDGLNWRRAMPPRLDGFRLGAAGYAPLTPDERGWLWLETVGAWLGVDGDRPRLYDAAGKPYLDPQEQAAAHAAAEARASQEDRARAAAEARADREADARATAEARASQEAGARAAAETRVQALEAELRRLRGEGSEHD